MLALVGAYQEAIDRGVYFSEVAGTSAGSIMAAFAGAGASSSQMESLMKRIDFGKFKQDPTCKESIRKGIYNKAGRLIGVKGLGYVLYAGGRYSSEYIEEFVDKELRSLLGIDRSIKFRDLLKPTYIIATDFNEHQARVFSERDEDITVAQAVRASCSIPIFFVPYGNRYVDGGVLSNLPAFVFRSNTESNRPRHSRLLAFSLQTQDRAEWDGRLPSYLESLATTVTEGSKRLQIDLLGGVNSIVVPTGRWQATDFEDMTADVVQTLINNGRTAAAAFFDNELTGSTSIQDHRVLDKEELYTSIILHQPEVRDAIFVDDYSFWAFNLFVALYVWRNKGIPVLAYLTKLEKLNFESDWGKKEEIYRRTFMRLLGITVIERDTVPFTGVALNALSLGDSSSVLLRLPKNVEEETRIVKYESYNDAVAIAHFMQALNLPNAKTVQATYRPSLSYGSQDSIERNLKMVSQYRQDGIVVENRNISLENVISLTKWVREHKFLQIEMLADHLSHQRFRLFEVLDVVLDTGLKSIMAPPVLEEWGNKLILFEGAARLLYCQLNGITHVTATVIRPRPGVPLPDLPADGIDLRQVKMVARKQPNQSWIYGNMRKIEQQIHNPGEFLEQVNRSTP